MDLSGVNMLRSVSGMQSVISAYKKAVFNPASENCATFCFDCLVGLGIPLQTGFPDITHEDVELYQETFRDFCTKNNMRPISVDRADVGAIALHNENGIMFFSISDGTKFLAFTKLGIVVVNPLHITDIFQAG